MAKPQEPVVTPYADENASTESTSSSQISESHILQDRKIGVFGAISLIVNKIVGAGIFSTPSSIFKFAGSPGMALILWAIAGAISTCGAMVMLEFGSGIPRSGGIKVYLERSFSPKLLMTCVYLFYCVFLREPFPPSLFPGMNVDGNGGDEEVSASNAITCASYLLQAASTEPTTWTLRGLAIAATAFAVGIHMLAPRLGRWLQDVLSAVKLFILAFIVCTGFAALGGCLRRIPRTGNLDVGGSFKGTSGSGYNIGTGLLEAIFSFAGFDNLNMVLSEVKNPNRSLRIALPTAMGSITVLYLLANIAYFAGVSREDFLTSDLTIAASLFKNVFGKSAATKALPALIAISAIGHLLGIAFTVPRVIQELAKDGITPFPTLFMQNRPFKTPIWGLLIHFGVTVLFICAPPAGDAFEFVVNLTTYPGVFLLTLVAAGLVKLRVDKGERWNEEREGGFRVPWGVLGFYLVGNMFVLIMPFVPPNGRGSTSLPYWLSPVVALSILALGVVYYLSRFVVLPWVFGYRLELTEVGLSDGSRVSRYKI